MIESTGSMGRTATHAEELLVAEVTRLRQENERLRALLRYWQFDVGGADEWLERETLAAVNGVPQPDKHR